MKLLMNFSNIRFCHWIF